METTSFDIFWEGDRGYFALGEFSYDSDLNGSVITRDNLEDLKLSFYDPNDFLVGYFDYDFPLDSENEFR
ncbi:MAG: calcium-binding protein, partial [Cyanobacteria bacterium P01_D01_bin.73]